MEGMIETHIYLNDLFLCHNSCSTARFLSIETVLLVEGAIVEFTGSRHFDNSARGAVCVSLALGRIDPR